nr:hypothetical protein [Lupinus angustifolius]
MGELLSFESNDSSGEHGQCRGVMLLGQTCLEFQTGWMAQIRTITRLIERFLALKVHSPSAFTLMFMFRNEHIQDHSSIIGGCDHEGREWDPNPEVS